MSSLGGIVRCYILSFFFNGRFPCKTRASTRRSGLAYFLLGWGFTVTSQGERFLDPSHVSLSLPLKTTLKASNPVEVPVP